MTIDERSFYEFLLSYADFLDDFAASEDKKYQSLISGDISRVDKSLADMQAGIMRLGKMEAKREELQSKAGWGGMMFREIVDSLSGGDRTDFTRVFDRMSRTTALIRYTNEKSMSYADLSLYINGLIPADETVDNTYNSEGEKKPKSDLGGAGTLFNENI